MRCHDEGRSVRVGAATLLIATAAVLSPAMGSAARGLHADRPELADVRSVCR